MLLISITGDDKPVLTDLIIAMKPYAVHWEDIGLKLGLKYYENEIISHDHKNDLNRAETCCRAMLVKWLENAKSPSWGKLDDVISYLKQDPVYHKGKEAVHVSSCMYL